MKEIEKIENAIDQFETYIACHSVGGEIGNVEAYRTALKYLQSELDRQENKPLTVDEMILLLNENERYPIWYQYANYEPCPEIMTAVATNRHTGEHKIYFLDENFAVLSEYTKFFKHKPSEETD